MPKSIRDIESLNLHREYIIGVGTDALIDLLYKEAKRSDYFILNKMDSRQFRLESKVSLGIGIITQLNLSLGPITLYCKIDSLGSNCSRLTVNTRTRIEVIIMAIFTIAINLWIYFSDNDILLWVYLIPIGVLLWFQMIYRWQEKGMLEEMEKVTGNPKEE